jgi:hypothetical protein
MMSSFYMSHVKIPVAAFETVKALLGGRLHEDYRGLSSVFFTVDGTLSVPQLQAIESSKGRLYETDKKYQAALTRDKT